MQQLSGIDNVMLFAERRNIYNHVAALLVYDVTTAPGGGVRFKDVLRHFEQRLYLHPVFRQRLVPAPLGVDRPYWVAEADIDLEYHIRHIALPKPGDWRQLMIQVARLHSRPLDRAHPLWEAYVIEGLDNIPKLPPGAFALFLKIHHAVADGMAAAKLMEQLHTSTPETAAEPAEPRKVIVDREPSTLELLARTVTNRVDHAVRFGRLTTRVGGRLLAGTRSQWPQLARGDLKGVAGSLKDMLPPPAPATRFGGQVSGHRVTEAMGLPLSRIKRVRAKVPGTTLNDVFVAFAGGAARRYLQARGELPQDSLVGLMPISLRSAGSAAGNEVSGVPVRVRSDVADPIERLRAVQDETQAGKARGERMGLDLLKNLLDVLPAPLAEQIFLRVIQCNLTVSNVRGPDQAMYLAGAMAMCMYPVSIPADGTGLNFTAVSYNGVLWVSMVSCREMMPDPGFMLDCMRRSWDELLAAADALPAPATAPAPAPARAPRRGRPAASQPRPRKWPARESKKPMRAKESR